MGAALPPVVLTWWITKLEAECGLVAPMEDAHMRKNFPDAYLRVRVRVCVCVHIYK